MNTDDTLPIDLPPECEARLLKFARQNALSVDEAIVFLVTRGVKHLSEDTLLSSANNGQPIQKACENETV